MSRCSRFGTVFPSGDTWNQMRGARPSGSMMLSAPTPTVSNSPFSRRQSSQVAKPSGGGSSSYPRAAAQNRASRSGSAQLITSWYRTGIVLPGRVHAVFEDRRVTTQPRGCPGGPAQYLSGGSDFRAGSPGTCSPPGSSHRPENPVRDGRRTLHHDLVATVPELRG